MHHSKAWGMRKGGTTLQKGFTGYSRFDIDALVLSKHVSKFLIGNTHSHPRTIQIRTYIFGQFRHVGLAETLHFLFRLIKGIKVGTTDRRTDGKSCKGVGKDGIESKRLDDGTIDVGGKVQGAFIGTQGGGILNSITAIHAHHTDIVNPGHSELQITFRFHELFGDKGITRIAIKNGRKTLKGGCDGINKFGFMSIASLGFAHE
mmetsp:Transcript_25355/g.45758  ORF Transcript_25355/g.45758 Transcript_25355/m.45758 type:complete len:204 (+) Transcript_25355:788-1399(+)